ncbi:hypothetical protein [Francisella sp. 19X1-34]|uniref:hypothetical protein n=1 Tax=Francisella sp. 19X1-34 TaxID=3087177 RepID=UPI002E310876|nr:hypothetical protein [Francisella sp. 19X1-34]MED7789240.1 hypothetical protein [Francisella sp. 19X1-34]
MKCIYKITNCIVLFCSIFIPTTLLAFVNISFIPTSGSTLNLVTTRSSSATDSLDLELQRLEVDNTFTQEGDTETIATGFVSPTEVSNVVVLPVSLGNNQITDKIIVMPLSTNDIFATIHVLNADLSSPQSLDIAGLLGITPTLVTTPILISNNSGVFIILGTGNLTNINSTLRIYSLNTTGNTLAEANTVTYSNANIIDIIPIDENIIAVIYSEVVGGTTEVNADIRSIITNTSMGEYSLNSSNDIEVTYDPSSFKTTIIASGSQVDISNAPSPYGVNKVFSQ